MHFQSYSRFSKQKKERKKEKEGGMHASAPLYVCINKDGCMHFFMPLALTGQLAYTWTIHLILCHARGLSIKFGYVCTWHANLKKKKKILSILWPLQIMYDDIYLLYEMGIDVGSKPTQKENYYNGIDADGTNLHHRCHVNLSHTFCD